jgi:hypothetical protein
VSRLRCACCASCRFVDTADGHAGAARACDCHCWCTRCAPTGAALHHHLSESRVLPLCAGSGSALLWYAGRCMWLVAWLLMRDQPTPSTSFQTGSCASPPPQTDGSCCQVRMTWQQWCTLLVGHLHWPCGEQHYACLTFGSTINSAAGNMRVVAHPFVLCRTPQPSQGGLLCSSSRWQAVCCWWLDH